MGLRNGRQIYYTIKSEDSIKKGPVISYFFAIIVRGRCYFLGGFGRLYSSQVVGANYAVSGLDSIVPHHAVRPRSILIAVGIVWFLSTSMSTLSSLVLTSSSTLTLRRYHAHSNSPQR